MLSLCYDINIEENIISIWLYVDARGYIQYDIWKSAPLVQITRQ